jgi:hypothetical protein
MVPIAPGYVRGYLDTSIILRKKTLGEWISLHVPE